MKDIHIRCSDEQYEELKKRAGNAVVSVPKFMLQAGLGLLHPKKYIPTTEATEAQILRGTSAAFKYYWRSVNRTLNVYKTELFGGDQQEFESWFGDLVDEAQKAFRSRSEAELEKFTNSGRMQARRMEYINSLHRSTEIPQEARSVFERVSRGELVGEVRGEED